MPDVDSVQVLVVARLLDEDLLERVRFRASCARCRGKRCVTDESHLVVQVVEVARNKNMNVSHDLQNIQTLMRRKLIIHLMFI